MSSLNKVDQPVGKQCRHRFACPGCGTRLVTHRRLTSLGRKVKTYCFVCEKIHRVWVPDYMCPQAPSGAPSEPPSS